jgi:sigma-B regulation protein RsbQ
MKENVFVLISFSPFTQTVFIIEMAENILLRNNVRVFGKGTQPLLFAHGFGCDQNMWRFVAPAFEEEYKIILFDYVGSGKSDIGAYKPERYGDLEGYAQDVLEICDALELRDVIFVGHSVSSMIGALASIERPEMFKSLILVVPSPCYINDSPDYVGGFDRADIEGLLEMMDKNYLGWASFLAPVIMKNSDNLALAEELEASFCSTDPVIARRFAEATFYSDNRADLPKVKAPALIIQVTDDAIAPVSVGEFIHRNLPDSTLRLMDASGHCPHMSHPQETIEIIKDYLNNTV